MPKDISDPSVMPNSLAHLVGQDESKQAIDVALTYAFTQDEPFPSPTLLTGPSSAGKSTYLSVIAAEMCVPYVEIQAQSLLSTADLNSLLLSCTTPKTIVGIDECHLLSVNLQTLLFAVIDKNVVYVNTGGRQPQSIKLPPLSILLATTNPENLLPTLKNRCALELNLREYTVEEIATIIHRRCKAMEWDVHEVVFPEVAARAKKEPRRALKLMQSCYRLAVANGDRTITTKHLEETCRIQQLDSLGLNKAEQDYLSVLLEGAARLNILASRLATQPKMIQDLETILVRLGLVGKDRQGMRELTPVGRNHVLKNHS